MKFLLLSLIISATISLSAQDPKFSVSIEQNRKTLTADGDKISLQSAPFNIVLDFSEPMSILIGAYFTSEDYELAKKGTPKSEIPSFVGGGMADYPFNEKKLIMVAPDAVGAWYYESDEQHSFDEVVKKDDGSLTCIRRIENIDDVYGEWTPIREISKPLYLVIITSKFDEDYNEIEIQRELLHLVFDKD